MKKTTRPCRRKECGKIIPYTLRKYCSADCERLDGVVFIPKLRTPIARSTKAINKVSPKRKEENKKYTIVRLQVLTEANFKCFVDGCHRTADTVEHQRGRVGFADAWAKENDIPLLIDKRFLKSCCSFHNLEFERNPELSKQYQLSRIHGGKKG